MPVKLNSTGDGNNTWYGSQVKVGNNATHAPYVYRSSSTYGGYTRMCFSFKRPYTTCPGGGTYVWVKVWEYAGYRTNYAWAVTSTASSTTAAY